MRFKLRSLFSLLLMIVAAYAVISARHWSFKAALFPLATAIPLFVLAGTQLILELFGGQETTSGPTVELEFSSDVDPAVARKRVAGILNQQSRVGWLLSFALTAAAWGIFYFLFQWLLNVQFEAGAIQTWMGW